jgi:hypothetical protein
MRLAKHHDLKCWPEYYQEVINGDKTFECRVNDRDFQVGDSVVLHEWDQNTSDYTGRFSQEYDIGYVLNLNKYIGAKTGHVVFSLCPVNSEVK